ncbi:NADP-dependent oxidoreductase [Frankia sp. CNm7]|uniref:NADP-dependent oxidoreductase n=1 Tax=Frankia nepalensis TaxID=1836974 RepID=A0A937ULR8_9ACTN|nr:NADP-dependent oxidoreductase [Frankia nepalensis]MBL7499002.1 NADP-dependent oxidoreductase [Frankia nepalensis]MBL7516033.1 NADP-dependent oxidoreductase [Frankia nepalensis]MBL7518062.1 NADP-dependent oxidoreductase [Frankia nepalensis]MBL7626072.1 NADP-dependent oxidoreductase [Frankia nepalensis]
MRAVAFPRFGAAPEIVDLPVPEPGPGEVLVRVRASSINGFDLGVLGGFLKGVYEYEFPVVLGKDFAGVVAAVGAGVSAVDVGDEVFGVVMRPTLGQGGLAEYVVVGEQYGLAPVPEGLDSVRAAALALAGTAALGAIDAVDPGPGDVILVSGATGGVGAYAVQLAAARGAKVIATARPGPEAAFVAALGASWTVDYADLVAGTRALAPRGVRAALHLAGDGASVASLVAPGGRFASTLHFTPEDHAERDLKATVVLADPAAPALTGLAAQVVDGRLRVPVARTYPLAEAISAITDFTAGAVGKLVVAVEESPA